MRGPGTNEPDRTKRLTVFAYSILTALVFVVILYVLSGNSFRLSRNNKEKQSRFQQEIKRLEKEVVELLRENNPKATSRARFLQEGIRDLKECQKKYEDWKETERKDGRPSPH